MPDVALTCPICGRELTATPEDRHPDTPPFVCNADARAWWGSELTSEARKAFDKATRSIPDADTRDRVLRGAHDERDVKRRKDEERRNPPLRDDQRGRP